MTGIHVSNSTEADILGFIASAMSAEVGVKLNTSQPEKDLQLLYRIKRSNFPNLPISFLPRDGQIWIVHNSFMNGKKFDAKKANGRLSQGPRDDNRGTGRESGQAVPSDIAE